MTEKQGRKIFKKELETFLKNSKQITEEIAGNVSEGTKKGTGEKISEIKEVGQQLWKDICYLEKERWKALKEMIECLEKMKKVNYYPSHKEEYHKLTQWYHEALKRHDAAVYELTNY
ncbi:hypothetical protein [Fusobacterium varium]|uniref:Uncharacterized protein n=1 Tax=Fusobacterium varium ATCC 27725 TaxID=469618 RepID=A0ABM6U247_FUSVA|nr:hypothetical protein [Fusobacterium varium]AVQ30363.1 hypothetical protein C4N18_03620 [Fusobacterium varium ATCC 27725]EES64599.1 hypothetical protein FVAG_01282 [Fusobacterium varium ATCC 27725]VEH37671.1 Uncharacterised protein [Fusobacterium varium]